MQITSGVVSYSRVVKDDDYGIKREAKVELSYMLAEGEALDLDHVKDMAVAKVHEMLRVKPATKSDAPPAASTQAGTPLPAAPAAGGAKAPSDAMPSGTEGAGKPKKANDKDKLAAAAIDKATPKKPVPDIETRQISTGEERDDMSELFGDDEPKPREITDVEVNAETQKAVARLKSAEKVKALKEKYVGPMPKTVRDVPQAQREQFLKDLKAL